MVNVLDDFIAHNHVGGDVEKSIEEREKKSTSKVDKVKKLEEKGKSSRENPWSKGKSSTGRSSSTSAKSVATGHKRPTGQSSSMNVSTGHKSDKPTGLEPATRSTGPERIESTGPKPIVIPTDMATGHETVEQNGGKTVEGEKPSSSAQPTIDGSFTGLQKQLGDFMSTMSQQNVLMLQTMGKLVDFVQPNVDYDMEDDDQYSGSDNDYETEDSNEVQAESPEDKTEDETNGEPSKEAMSAIDSKMAKIRQDYAKEVEGPAVSSKMADLVNDMLGGSLTLDQINKKVDSLKRPSNIPHLIAPLVSERVWKLKAIQSHSKSADVKFQQVQKMLTSGLVPLIRVIDEMSQTKNGLTQDKVNSLAVELLEGLQMLTATNNSINMKRKDTFREDLPKYLQPLCNHSRPVTKDLFGDEVDKEMEVLDKAKRFDYEGRAHKNKAPKGRSFLGGREGSNHAPRFMPGRRSLNQGQWRQGQWGQNQWAPRNYNQGQQRPYGQERSNLRTKPYKKRAPKNQS